MADRVLVRAGGMELEEVVLLSLQRLVPTAAALFLCVFICYPIFHCRGFHVCFFWGGRLNWTCSQWWIENSFHCLLVLCVCMRGGGGGGLWGGGPGGLEMGINKSEWRF